MVHVFLDEDEGSKREFIRCDFLHWVVSGGAVTFHFGRGFDALCLCLSLCACVCADRDLRRGRYRLTNRVWTAAATLTLVYSIAIRLLESGFCD